jgi:Na+/H+ antiporter NhaD/arsenite permease-like protein
VPVDLGAAAPFAALALLAAVFALFVIERRPPEVTAFVGAAAALAFGLVNVDDVLGAIANPAPATIAAMFVLSAALVRTGALEEATSGSAPLPRAARWPRSRPSSPRRLPPRPS